MLLLVSYNESLSSYFINNALKILGRPKSLFPSPIPCRKIVKFLGREKTGFKEAKIAIPVGVIISDLASVIEKGIL